MDGLDKAEKILIISLVIAGVVTFSLLGLSIYEGWYLGTHPDYGMTTVKTGDVTWGLPDRQWHDHRLRHSGGIPVKKILEEMILKWHQAGYTLDEIAPLVPQVPKAAVAAIIHQHDKETRL